MSAEPEPLTIVEESHAEEKCEGSTLRVIGWFSVGMAVAALGIYLGYELRKGYKFNRRTPYDFFSGAGEQQTSEFGMGV
ncbi:MAG: hypothetical protein ABR898_15835 [Terracidiphilus sp.]|jgi:hypothetical protein